MNNSLERLIEGMIATLRNHVIANISDAYARGQAIGVIDLLNNIGPRIEWARAPIVQAIEAKRKAIAEARALTPGAPKSAASPSIDALVEASSEALAAERDRLDGEVADLLQWCSGPAASGDAAGAIAMLRRHIHDELTLEMKRTKKPLFAEIARGVGARNDKDQE
jgi:hypothetical protein